MASPLDPQVAPAEEIIPEPPGSEETIPEPPDALAPTRDLKTGLPSKYAETPGPFGAILRGADVIRNVPILGALAPSRIQPASAAMAVPGGPLTQMALQPATAALEAGIAGERDPMQLLKEAGKAEAFTLGGLGLGKLTGGITKQFTGKAADTAAEAANKAAKEAYASKEAHDIAMTGAVSGAEKSAFAAEEATKKGAFEAAKVAHAQNAGKEIAQDLISSVPALKGTEASGKGLYDAIYGSGIEKVHKAYDEALKQVVAKGTGQIVQVPIEVADRLGLKTAGGTGVAGLPANIQALFNRGAQKAGMNVPAATQGTVPVDAGELANSMVGKWADKNTRGAYRVGTTILDKAGIGDSAARAAYKAWSGIGTFIDRAKMLDANGVVDIAKGMKALADMKKLSEITRRGLGSGTEGAVQGALRGAPTPPAQGVPPAPRIYSPAPPPTPIQPGTRSVPNPLAGHPYGLGAAALGALGLGHPGIAAPLLVGGAISAALPKRIYTQAPIPPILERILRGAGPLGASARQMVSS